jgi:macrolide-specific efflux system membrane fusion protein
MQPMQFWRRRTFVLNAVLGVLLLAGGATACLLLTSGKPATATTLRTVAVAQGTVTATVSADGSVESATSMTADFATPGQVTDILVKVGDLVASGQTLARVDATDVQADLAAAKRNRTSARDALDRAEAGGNADAIANARNQLDQANANVAAAQRKVDGTVLKAPMAGTVVAVNGAIGGSSNVQNGFIQLADLAHLQIKANVPEADATRLKVGQTASVTWNALTDARVTGKVSAISPTAATGNVVQYPITVALDSAPDGARLGQSVKLTVTVDQVENAIYVPAAAVRTAGNRTTVIVVKDGKEETRAVQIGLKGDSFTVITEGLSVGEQVLLATVSGSTNQQQFPFGGGGQIPGGGTGPGGGGRGGNR